MCIKQLLFQCHEVAGFLKKAYKLKKICPARPSVSLLLIKLAYLLSLYIFICFY